MPKRRRALLNVVPDRLDLRDRPYEPAITTAPPPRLNTLAAKGGGTRLQPLNQEDTSACTGFGLARTIDLLLMRAGRKSEAPVSPFMIYSMARRYDEFAGYKADEGSSVRGALKGWFKHGACARKLWPDLEMPSQDPQSPIDWWQDAATRPLGAYYRVDTRSVTDMHVALSEVGVLYASAVCHVGWDEGSGVRAQRKIWTIPYTKAAPDDGGHAFCIVGYDENGFIILNSWGQWGTHGLAVLTYKDWLENAMDCWVAQLGVPTTAHLTIAKSVSLRTDPSGKKVSLAADRVLRNREISPFVVDMENNGELSNHGEFRTGKDDLQALVTVQLAEARRRWGIPQNKPVDVALYAHGGLVSEDAAADTAARWIPALYDVRIFPIFVMWETDIFSTLKSRLSDLIFGIPSPEARPTAGLRDQVRRFLNERIEGTLAKPGSFFWDEMKQNAQMIGANPESGLRLLYHKGTTLGNLDPGDVRLHLIGHSAGSIVHSHIAGSLLQEGWNIASAIFMAPAVRQDVFHDNIGKNLGKGIGVYHQFHLADEVEQRDPTCKPLLTYGRSLLYLVSESFEHPRATPILGMEKYFTDYGRRLGGAVHVHAAPGTDTSATTHGGFDDDARTMKSVIEIIQGLSGGARGVGRGRAGGGRRRASGRRRR